MSFPPMHSPKPSKSGEFFKREDLPPIITPMVTPSATPKLRSPRAQQLHLLDELPAVTCIVRGRIPTTSGADLWIHLYHNSFDKKEHLALVFGDCIRSRSLFASRPGEDDRERIVRGAYNGTLYPGRTLSHDPGQPDPAPPDKAPLVRIHSECYTGETAWSRRCDCGEQLDEAARLMAAEGSGCIVYLRQEGRGIGLGEKLKAYNLQDLGNDTVQANLLLRHPADARSYGLATSILLDLGLTQVRLLTNNPDKVEAVEGPKREIRVVQRVPMVPLSWQGKGGVHGEELKNYLQTKIDKMGHMLPPLALPNS